MVVSGGFGSAFIIVEVAVDMIEIDGSMGRHVVIWVVLSRRRCGRVI